MTEQVLTTMEDALGSVLDIKLGDVVEVEVLAFDDNQVRVSIKNSGGLEGVIPRKELSSAPFAELTDVTQVGDTFEVVVLKPIQDKENGNYLVSKRRVDSRKVWAELEAKLANKETITATVKDASKSGLVVDAGVRGFVPSSMVSERFIHDLTPFKGQTLEFDIVEISANDNRLILSRKEIAKREQVALLAERLDTIEEGAVLEGTVARLADFGAFVTVNGVDGLVHVSQISHKRISKPADALKVGETVNVKVLSVDKETGKVSLSIKATLERPWDNIEEKAAVGSVFKGIVKRLADFGAFVEILPGVEGLVHVSQIAHEHIEKPGDKLTPGQEVDVKVLNSSQAEQRVSLSIKALVEKPVQEVEEKVEQPKKESAPRPRKPKLAPKEPATFSDADSGFTLADMLGDALSDLKSE